VSGKEQEPTEPAATQHTDKGLEIAVPKRKDVMDAFRKIVHAPKKHF
jgi:DNA-binding cell septation regulator SpoVG